MRVTQLVESGRIAVETDYQIEWIETHAEDCD